jgi:hypothetical protein
MQIAMRWVGGAELLFKVGQALHHGDVVVAVDRVITVQPLEVFAGGLLLRLCVCCNVYISDACCWWCPFRAIRLDADWLKGLLGIGV